jgi:hypothetical protein
MRRDALRRGARMPITVGAACADRYGAIDERQMRAIAQLRDGASRSASQLQFTAERAETQRKINGLSRTRRSPNG